jgi:hypothetical protein
MHKGDEKWVQKFLVGKPDVKRSHGIRRCTWRVILKYLKEIVRECVDWMYHRVQWRAFGNTVMKPCDS